MPAICGDGQRHVAVILLVQPFSLTTLSSLNLSRLERDRNLSNQAYLEMHLPDGQCSHGMGPDIPAMPNESV
jgi:hypothetical protein